MPNLSHQGIKVLRQFDPKRFTHAAVACVVLSHDNKIVLQQRDDYAPTAPNCLSTFGGGIESNETPMEALVRELNEELGAIVKPEDVVTLGVITEPETNPHELLYVYFWHDKHNTITGCYEGKANYYRTIAEINKHPKITDEVHWMLRECKKRKRF